MIQSHFYFRVCMRVAFAAICGSGFVGLAEQPPAAPPVQAESKHTPPERRKPQVIYNLPRTPASGATLHAQDKSQSNVLPVVNNTPKSLQVPRAAPPEVPAEGPTDSSVSPSKAHENGNSAEAAPQRRVKQKKIQSNRPNMRRHTSPKGHEPTSSHGKK